MIKVVLPLIVFIIIGLLLIWPQISDIETAPLTQQDISALQEAQSENLLLNPVFNTLDDKGKPFSITAHEARQNRDDRDKIVLTAPAAEMNNDDNTFYLEAENGEYDQMRKTLILNNDVVLKDKKNNVLTTQDLTTSIADGKARSNSPAKLTTTQGSIEGQSVIIDQQNQTTTFQGPAKAVINP